MKRMIINLACFLFASAWANAESSVWKVQKGDSVLYLGGTCHMLRKADYPLPPEYDRAYHASEVVVFETDIGELQQPAMQQKLLTEARYADGSTLEQHLSTNTFSELRIYCESNEIPLESFMQYKPSVLMVSLALMELMKLGVTQKGVDPFFYERAMKDQKKVQGLETVNEQIHYIVSMADGYEDEFVTYTLGDMKNIRQQFETISEAWRRGDTKELNEFMVNDLKTRWPELYQKVIVNRNQKWLPLLDEYQKTPETEFILVGVGHLVGPDGVIEALKGKGYKVTQL
jgi:uncharacterized protein YbaP (TraB family)